MIIVCTGSHNVVVGKEHNLSSYGGLVVGWYNDISGINASVSGGYSRGVWDIYNWQGGSIEVDE